MAAPRKHCRVEKEVGKPAIHEMMSEMVAPKKMEDQTQEQPCKIMQLPHEAFLHIATFLDPADICALSRTCRKAHALVFNGM